MKVATRTQPNRYQKNKPICPQCKKHYLKTAWGQEGKKFVHIGLYCPNCEYIKKDKERKAARIKRNEIRYEHPCAEQSNPCHLSGHDIEDWCDNCKIVQPYYEDYMSKMRAAIGARLKLNTIVMRAS